MYTAGIEYGGELAAAFVHGIHPQVVYRAWGSSQYGKQRARQIYTQMTMRCQWIVDYSFLTVCCFV